MSSIITADLHFTDNSRDAYRWKILTWLAGMAEKHKVDQVLILGDLTVFKDKHSASLVNKLATKLYDIGEVAETIIVMGNHDYIDPAWPFFEFMRRVDRVSFFAEPVERQLPTHGKCAFLPATKEPEREWARWIDNGWKGIDYVFTHHTFSGASAENGEVMSGTPLSIFKGSRAKIYSGDIHKPQVLGKNPSVTYVGAPYHVRFGDEFKPRVLLLDDDGATTNLSFPAPRKHVLVVRRMSDLDSRQLADIPEGDHVEIRAKLTRADLADWPELRKKLVEESQRQKWVLCDVGLESLVENKREKPKEEPRHRKPEDIVRHRAREQKLARTWLNLGLNLLREE